MSNVTEPSDIERSVAKMKSYTGAAVLVFFVYWLFWLPGLIVNLIYRNEAKRMEQIAGQSLPGVGCLTIMLWLNLLVPVLLIAGVFMFLTQSIGVIEPKPQVVVPNVQNLNIYEASSVLEGKKLKVRLEDGNTLASGTVASQDPNPGEAVDIGSVVYLSVNESQNP